jgi:hypothetical protein
MRLTAAVLVAILAVLSPQASAPASAANNAKGGSGTVTLKPGFESGSFDFVLAPNTGAKSSEKIVGNLVVQVSPVGRDLSDRSARSRSPISPGYGPVSRTSYPLWQ